MGPAQVTRSVRGACLATRPSERVARVGLTVTSQRVRASRLPHMGGGRTEGLGLPHGVTSSGSFSLFPTFGPRTEGRLAAFGCWLPRRPGGATLRGLSRDRENSTEIARIMLEKDQEEIYQEHILDHYEDPYHRGSCAHTTHTHEDDNPLCGDVVRVELDIDEQGVVKQAWFNGDGCCVSQASASMLMEKVEGQTVDEIREFTAEQMLDLYGPRLTPNRQKCCLLSWRVLQSAVFSPVDPTAEETGRGEQQFNGPDLGEES